MSMSVPDTPLPKTKHTRWVKGSHWIVTLSFLALAFSGFVIVMCHPRFYWGEVGNDLTPALFELPVSRNYQHGGWSESVPVAGAGPAVSASRTYEIFNENGWGRSLHFLSAWFLVLAGVFYFLMGIFTKHFQQNLWPGKKEFSPRQLLQDVMNHFRWKIPSATGGPRYGLLQKCTYMAVIFFAFPLMVLTGFAMSPAINAAYPFLSGMFGGTQSARTLHFLASVILVLFLLVHIVMIIKSGFKKQIRAMTIGEHYEKKTPDQPS